LELHADAGRGLLELGLDRPDAAVEHVSYTLELARRSGYRELNYVQWTPDLIESQIRADLESEAHSTLADFESEAPRTPHPTRPRLADSFRSAVLGRYGRGISSTRAGPGVATVGVPPSRAP